MKYPHFRQYDAKDCGPACLRMIGQYYGQSYSQHFLRNLCFQKRSGTTLLGLSDAGNQLGFSTIGVSISFNQLEENVKFPCVITWNQNHFVVVYKITKGKITIGDPAQGILVYDRINFLKSWSNNNKKNNDNVGIALLFEPNTLVSEPYISSNEKFNFINVIKYLKPYRGKLANICLGLLFASLLGIIFPLLTQLIVDVGIVNKDLNLIIVILISQVVIVIGQASTNLIKNLLMVNVTTKVGITLVSDFLSKLLRLPIAFFDSKKVGDLLQRIDDFTRVQKFLTEILISIFMALMSIVVFSFIIVGYSKSIFLVFAIGSITYVIWILFFLKYRRKLDYMRFQESASNQSNIIQLITGMQDIKLNNCEKIKQKRWKEIQLKLYDIEIKGLSLSQIQQMGGLFIEQFKNLIITYIVAQSVIMGEMTLGMMMVIQYILGQLNAPINQFVSFIQSIQNTHISLERLNEILMIEDEEPINNKKIKEIPKNADIRLEGVDFQYDGPRSKKVLRNISLSFKTNQTTAIVGMSGSGKTTLLKLLLGYYKPVSGNIYLNEINLNEYSESEWRKSCGVVMQEGVIFSDSILDNIALDDEAFIDDEIDKAVKLANLYPFIDSLPLGFNTQIGPEGNGISTGQKQRILIARAIYKDANVFMFDEATNSLDANNERAIMKNLTHHLKNKTAIIVAHRLSTVMNADNIIVLDNGIIVEQGKHDQLVKRRGHYFRLVKNQLELGN